MAFFKTRKTIKRKLVAFLLAVSLSCSIGVSSGLTRLTASAASGDVAINTTNFPDYAFRSTITRLFDTNKDNVLSSAEIAAATRITLNNRVESLKGIEFFTELQQFYYSGSVNLPTNIQTIDLSKNTKLRRLRVDKMGLTSLDISMLTQLESLDCAWNQLTTLDVSKNTNLTSLNCTMNQLTALDVSKNKKLTYLDCGSLGGSTMLIGTRQDALPANTITTLDVSMLTELETLKCGSNKLTALDISKNKKLKYLDCGLDPNFGVYSVGINEGVLVTHTGNQIQSLDISNNPELTTVRCRDNVLKTLDTSKNPKLEDLDLMFNNIATLDVGKNTSLKYLNCSYNSLSTLDVTRNTSLNGLYCSNNSLSTLDVTRNTSLEEFKCSKNSLSTLDVTRNTSLETLYCSGNSLSTLDVTRNTSLKYFKCSNNPLSNLNVTNNTQLLWLYFEGCNLKSIDLSRNNSLTELRLDSNHFASLSDMSKFPFDFMGSYLQRPDFSALNQTVELGKIPTDSYNLRNYDSNIDGTKITNLKGATLNGTVIRGYKRGTPITYDYLCDSRGNKLSVSLNFTTQVTSTITYKDGSNNFNSWKAGYTAPTTYEEGDAVKLPTADNIEKEHYTFVGWYDNAALQGTPITEIDAGATGDKTLYAKFEVDQYTVTFKDWDGSILKTEQVAFNGTATAPADPTRDGYRFTGWDSSFSNITGNTEVTAEYVKTWTVTFKDDDGSILKTETVDEGKGATAPTEPTKVGHAFAGWDVAFDNITADTEVTATYSVNQYTVTFKDWDGSILKTEQVAFNGTATAPADPTRDGYRFTGWDSSFSNITGNTEVTAEYVKTDSEKSDETNMSDVPQTGDNSSFALSLTAAFVSLAALLTLPLLRRKEKQKMKHLRR